VNYKPAAPVKNKLPPALTIFKTFCCSIDKRIDRVEEVDAVEIVEPLIKYKNSLLIRNDIKYA
jgi:hypothetical protein